MKYSSLQLLLILAFFPSSVQGAQPNPPISQEFTQQEQISQQPVVTPSIVAKSTWEELAVLLRGRYGDVITGLHADPPNVISRSIPVEDRFVAAYAFIATNKSSDTMVLLSGPAYPLIKDDVAAWLRWTRKAISEFPDSPRIQVLNADAIARINSPAEALAALKKRTWISTKDPADLALAEYLIASCQLALDLSDDNGRGPARSAFDKSLAYKPLSAVETGYGYYFLSEGHFIIEKADNWFRLALSHEPDFELAKAGLSIVLVKSGQSIDQKEQERLKRLGTFSVAVKGIAGVFTSFAAKYTSPASLNEKFGGAYSIGPENEKLLDPLTEICSVLGIK